MELYLQCYGLHFDAYYTFLIAFLICGRGGKGGKHRSHLRMGGAELGMHVQGVDSPTGSSGSETDATAAAIAAAGSSSSSRSAATGAAVGVPFPQTRAKPKAGIRGGCVEYWSCKVTVTAGAPLCPRC